MSSGSSTLGMSNSLRAKSVPKVALSKASSFCESFSDHYRVEVLMVGANTRPEGICQSTAEILEPIVCFSVHCFSVVPIFRESSYSILGYLLLDPLQKITSTGFAFIILVLQKNSTFSHLDLVTKNERPDESQDQFKLSVHDILDKWANFGYLHFRC